MRPEPDAPGDFTHTEPEIPRANPELPISNQSQGTKPYRGGYYWLPTPSPEGITWSVVSCRDLGCGADAGHDADLWPRLMVPLAATWGKNAQILKRRLALAYTGLPRGRVTQPDKTFLVLHGKDSPVQGFEGMVIASFRLSGRKVKFIFDEHETQLPGHPQTVEASLGLRLYESGS
jgi:hypothetical protein